VIEKMRHEFIFLVLSFFPFGDVSVSVFMLGKRVEIGHHRKSGQKF
jgi:hypothetical protein